jgi:2-polyprenyl-6-hydroxyphenyl methylase/3-demethylubiquinone-9 3-methyltransferase
MSAPESSAADHAREIAEGKRFPFGKNWRAFIETMSEDAIAEAMKSLRAMLKRESLAGVRFLDIGSGSGLFSLAAHRLGATVTSFDFDPDSVGCTQELRHRYAADAASWTVMQGSALDTKFMEALGTFDIVYSWGVLHHTGAMWPAIWNAVDRVKPGGTLFIAIYNDQGAWSHRWAKIKRFYVSGTLGKAVVCSVVIPYWVIRGFAADVVWGRNPMHRYTQYGKNRGMSAVRDWFDWLGGYPFEFATPEGLIMPLQEKGFRLQNLVTQRGTVGCIELVMQHDPDSVAPTRQS